MAAKAYRSNTDWANTAEGHAKWKEARETAQALANKLGFDHGIERNDFFKTFRVFILPRRENRYGHERMCEVVSPENLDVCASGHGPVIR